MATLQTTPLPKEKKRRNSEKRKLKSRNAARTRREKETAIFYELAHELPMPHSMCAQLDKSGIMRLLLSFLKIRKFTPKAIKSEPVDTGDEESTLSIDHLIDNYYLKALDGFAMTLSQEGDIIFISENVSQYMGLKQIDLMGQSIYDYSHPCDHEEIREHLSDHPRLSTTNSSKTKPKQEERHNFIIRMKCTLTAKGKIVTQKAAIYKVVCCNGLLKVAPSEVTTSGYRLPEVNCVSLIAMPIQHPANIEIPMDRQTFLTRHSMDMKFTYCDERIKDLLGYDPDDLVDKSFYDFYHAMDSHVIDKCHRDLFAKGQASSGKYRFLAKKSGYAWMETQATVIYNSKTNKPQCVVCVNYMISGVEDDKAVISTHQLDEGMQLSTEEIFVPRPDDIEDDVFPLYLTGSKSKVANPEDLTYLAPTPGSAMVPLDFTSPVPNLPKTPEAQELQPQVGTEQQTQEFVPFFPFVPLDSIPEDQQSSDGGTNQESSPTPDLILPETKSHMRSNRDPLLLDGFMETQAQLDDLSKRAPYISLNDDFDFGCDQQLSDAELPDDSWEPVNIFGSSIKTNPCVVAVDSSSLSDERQDLLSPLSSDCHTAPATPYSQISIGSPMTPVQKLCQSMPNLWVTTDDCGDSELSGQPPGNYMWPSPPLQQQPSPLASPTGSQTTNESSYYIDLNQSKQYSPHQSVKRKRETRDVQPLCKVARRDNQGQEAGVSFDGGGSEMRGVGWDAVKNGVELTQPPSDEGMSDLQTLLFQQDGTNINNFFGHSLLLQKVAQQVVNKANMAPSSNVPVSNHQLSPGAGARPNPQFPSFLTQPVTDDPKDKASADNTLMNCLLLTSQDLDVNTPLQASTGLLQGEDLLRALDVP